MQEHHMYKSILRSAHDRSDNLSIHKHRPGSEEKEEREEIDFAFSNFSPQTEKWLRVPRWRTLLSRKLRITDATLMCPLMNEGDKVCLSFAARVDMQIRLAVVS